MKIRDRIKSLRRVKASDLLPNPRNWRTHPEAQANAMRGILAEVGYAGAALARETPDGLQLIDGHLRAELTPDQKIPVLVLDVTEEEADKILATFDPVGKMAEADEQKLGELLAEIETESEGLQVMLDELAESEGIDLCEPGAEEEPPEPQIDRAAELQKEWRTELGQLWVIGEHRLLCADSTKAEDVGRVIGNQQIGTIATDPPYAFGLASTSAESSKSGGWHDMMNNSTWFASLIRQWQDVARGGLWWMFCNWRTLPIIARAACDAKEAIQSVLIWHKDWIGPGGPKGLRPSYEMVILFTNGDAAIEDRGQPDVITIPWSSHKPSGHNAEKPVDLLKHLVGLATGHVFDPFLGSGTTMVAAQELDRRCFGIEISPAYCAVILQRMKDLTGETPVLEA